MFLYDNKVALLLLWLALAAPEYHYREAVAGHRFAFPHDWFNHEDFRTEWWYYTGNVATQKGHRYGFELVFFRQAQRRGESGNRSAWRVDDLYLAHLALTDITGKRFTYYERLNRTGPGIAGASEAEHRIWNGNWSAVWNGEDQTLQATAEGIRLQLELRPLQPVVVHGVNGVSQKAEGAGKASYYISLPRLEAKGGINGQAVQGTAWMDHEWFTHQLTAEQQGWDWFSAQLADGTELMLFQLRHKDGGIDRYSAGTFIDRDGKATHLSRNDFSLQPEAFWTSPKTKARYPVRWRVQAPKLRIDIECEAAIPNQELVGEHGGPTYWEGAVGYRGNRQGAGYLEMTGYDKAIGL